MKFINGIANEFAKKIGQLRVFKKIPKFNFLMMKTLSTYNGSMIPMQLAYLGDMQKPSIKTMIVNNVAI